MSEGDTYAYDTKNLATQEDCDEKVANRIFGMLPNEQKIEMMELFYEFEEGKTPEAKFAKTMDNFQPILLNDSNNGKDWRVHGIKKCQVEKRQKNSQLGSNDIWEYTSDLIERNVKKGNLIDE